MSVRSGNRFAINRERLAWVLCVAVLTVLTLRLPGSFGQRDDDYQFVRTLVDIHRQVVVNYVEPVDESALRDAAVAGMLSRLDPFSEFIPPSLTQEFNRSLEGTFLGVGIQVNQLESGAVEVVTPVEGSPAFEAGVQAGDRILRVNGEDITGLRLPEVVSKIRGPAGTRVTLLLRRVTGEELELTMPRAEFVVPTLKGYRRTADNSWNYWVREQPKVAYIRITQFTPDTTASLEPLLRRLLAEGMQGLVLDLRFNPGGRLDQAISVADLFLDAGVIVSTRGRNRPETVIRATAENTLPKFPMAVIINEASASASEILAGALADNRRAAIVGTRSYGKGSVQEVIPLPGRGGELKLTTAYYYLPSGRLVHRMRDATTWGVEPMVNVPLEPPQARAVWEARLAMENFRPPSGPRSGSPGGPTRAGQAETQPAAEVTERSPEAATSPAGAGVVDTQLEHAVTTVLAMLMFSPTTPADVSASPATVAPSPAAIEHSPPTPGTLPAPRP